MDDAEFQPFVPPTILNLPTEQMKRAAQIAQPTQKTLAAAESTKPPRKKRERESRPPQADKPAIPPAPDHKRPKRKKKTDTKTKKTINKAFKATRAAITENLYGDRKKKKVRTLKLDMASAMAISATLKPSDFKIFESLVEILQIANKATRRRILTAVGKVFG